MKTCEIWELDTNFKNFKTIAGTEGLNREITDVEIMEIPDGVYWIKEGDFVITTAYFLENDVEKFKECIKVLS